MTVLSANGFVRLPIAYLTFFRAVFDSATFRTEFESVLSGATRAREHLKCLPHSCLTLNEYKTTHLPLSLGVVAPLLGLAVGAIELALEKLSSPADHDRFHTWRARER